MGVEAGMGGTECLKGGCSGLGINATVIVQTLFPTPQLCLLEAWDLVRPSCAQLLSESIWGLKDNLSLGHPSAS